jgi:hypothetical protein
MNSMFHFGKKEHAQEVAFLTNVFGKSAPGTPFTIYW